MPTVVVTETISTHYIDASGNTYNVEVSYGPEAGIPSGAKLAVSELTGDEAEAYIGAALEAVENDGNNGENAGNNKKTTLKYAKALDISILKDGVEVRPVAPVSVSIKLLDAPNLDEFDEANVVHFGDEAEVVESNIQREAVRFETDGFSVYVVTYTLSTFYMDAAGNTFNIEVEYDREAGIPSGATLSVSELTGDEADAYAARAAEALNVNGSQVAYAKALDISILADGAPVQPQTPVSVSIKLLDAPDTDENTDIDVIHFGEAPEQLSCAFDGDAVAFEADGFSVYVVTYTVESFYKDAEGNTWRITASYGADTGIPGNAELLVRELDAAEREAYLDQAAQALDTAAENVSIDRAFDIRLGKDGTEYHSASGEVQVSIQLLDTGVTEDMRVVHMGDKAQLMDAAVQGDALSFATDGFSVFAVVEAKAPINTGANVQTLEELGANYASGQGFYLSYGSPQKYFTNSLNSNGAFTEASELASASKWYFESSGAENTYYICTNVDGVKKYMTNTSGNLMGLTDDSGSATAFELTPADAAKFYFKRINSDKYLQHSNGGGGMRLYDGTGTQANSQIIISYAGTPDNYYELDGKTYSIANLYSNDAGIGLAADLSAKPIQRWDDASNSGDLWIDENDAVADWNFTYVADANAPGYRISTQTDSGTKYLAVGSGGLSLSNDPCVFTVSSNAAGQYSFSADGRYLSADNSAFVSADAVGYLSLVTLQKIPLTITAGTVTKTYDGTGTVEYATGLATTSGLQNGHDIQSLTLTSAQANAGGPYALVPGNAAIVNGAGTDVTGQYEITYANGTLTITKAMPIVTAPAAVQNLTYDGQSHALVTAGNTTGGTLVYSLTDGDDYSTVIPTATDADTYTVYYKVNGGENYDSVDAASVSVTIAKATPVATVTATNPTYNGEAQALVTAATTSGTLMFSQTEDGEYSADIPTATDADTYTVYYKVDGNDNYNSVEAASVSVTIAKATPVVTAPVAVEDLTYDGQPHALVTAGSTTGGALVYSLTEDGEYSADIPTATNADTYTVYYKVIGNDNYNSVNAQSVSVTIAKATPTVTAPEAIENLTYDGQSHALVTAGSTTSGTLMFSQTEDGEYSADIPTATDADTYTVYYKVDGNDNYNSVEAASVSVTIEKANPVVTIAATDPTYNGEAQALVTAETTGGTLWYALGEDDENAPAENADEVTNWSTAVPVGVNAGTYYVWYKVEGGDNYISIGAQSVSVTIEKANPVVIVEATDPTYNGSEQALVSGTTTGGTLWYALGDDDETAPAENTDGDTKWSTTVPVGVNAGTYYVWYKVEGNDNYNPAEAQAVEAFILPMPVTLTANSDSAQYDENDPEKLHSVDGYICTATASDGHTVVLYDESQDIHDVAFVGISAHGEGADIGMHEVTFTGVTVSQTKDTTGNYLVTEAISGMLIITDSSQAPIAKRMTEFDGNLASYEIVVNPGRDMLNSKSLLTLKDTFSSNQSIIYSSVEVTIEGSKDTDGVVTYDYSGYTGTFTIPDETAVTITYTTRVNGIAGQTVKFDNTARLGRYGDSGFVGCASTTNEEELITPQGTDITGTGGVYTIELFAYANGHMEQGLAGATFRLLDSNQNPMVYLKDGQNQDGTSHHAGEDITFTTGSGNRLGYATVKLTEDEDGLSIHKNTAYYLEMISAPYTVTKDDNDEDVYTYYQKDNTLYSFLITDSPNYSYGGIYSYFNGDVLKVRCYEESAGVNITKRFSGNYALTKSQQNAVKFVLQKEDTEAAEEKWDEIERHAYSDFYYGSLNFNTGTVEAPLLPNSHYRVIEENADSADLGLGESIEHTVSYSISYQSDGQIQEEESNDFYTWQDDLAHNYSVVADNKYIDHKLTVAVLNEETGAMIPGAVFEVYTASDETTALRTYTTGKSGALDIRKGDAGTNYADDTLYYAVQKTAPTGYLLPDEPERIYFYFSKDGIDAPEGATDLTKSYNIVTVSNHADRVRVPVTVTWGLDESATWPNEVHHIVLGLVQSVDGGDPEPVEKDGDDWTIELDSTKFFDNSTFVDLPALDDQDREITYDIVEKAVWGGVDGKEDITANYASSCDVSGTGWYVVKHRPAISVVVEKQWYELNELGQRVPVEDSTKLAGKPAVTFDLYRMKVEDETLSTREDLVEFLGSAKPVRKNVTLDNAGKWTRTVPSLEATYKTDDGEKPYYYFALEQEQSMPDNHEDSYVIEPAEEGEPRKLTIVNSQTPITVTVTARNLTKVYGEDDPAFVFDAKVQDSNTTLGKPDYEGFVDNYDISGPVDGVYTITARPDAGSEFTIAVTDTSTEPATSKLTFTCSRTGGEDVNTGEGYAITLDGDEEQEGYRVILKGAALTVTQKPIIVKADKSKTYGADDPDVLVSFYRYVTPEGGGEPVLTPYEDTLENGDATTVIEYQAERDPGEDVGTYSVDLTGEASQGNYSVTFESDGVFTINPAVVTVIPNAASKVYGEDDPDLSATVSGLQFDDDEEVIDYVLCRAEGEDVTAEGEEYTITATGAEFQGNYCVNYEQTGKFTIVPAVVTLKVEDADKVYGSQDPEYVVDADGVVGSDTIAYTTEREEGEDVGYYVVTPKVTGGAADIDAAGKTYYSQGNYNVYCESGVLTIERAELTIKADDVAKIIGTNDRPGHVLTATLTGLVDRDQGDDGLVEHSNYDEQTGVYTVTYTREGSSDPEITFTLQRQSGETAGDYTITAAGIPAESLLQKNYVVEYEEGTFTILPLHEVIISQETVDPMSSDNPAYTYDWTATLDTIDGYSASGTIDLPLTGENLDNPNATSISLPHGAKLTVIQRPDEDDVNYETTLSVDGAAYDNTSETPNCIELDVDDYYTLKFTHLRNCLPVHARTEPEADTETGAVSVTGSNGFMAIPEDVLAVEDFEKDYKKGFTLPTDKYFVFEHASLYNANGTAIENAAYVTGIAYDAKNSRWRYTTDPLDGTVEQPTFNDVLLPGAQLVMFYKPVSVCKIEADGEYFYTLGAAMDYIKGRESKAATIEMLIDEYIMRSAEVVIPADQGYDITLKTAETEYTGGTDKPVATILRDASFTTGDMLECFAGLTLDNIIIDGNGVNSANVMVSVKKQSNAEEDPVFTLGEGAVLKNAIGNNGAAFYMNGGTATISGTITGNQANNGGAAYIISGTVTFDENADLTGNTATQNGGAVYVNNGTVNLNSANVTGNSAVQGGALYMARFNNNSVTTVTLNGTIGGTAEGSANTATDGGAIYVQAGTLTVAGSILGNTATGNGGGLYMNGGTVTVSEDGVIGGTEAGSGNSAVNGGGLYRAAGTLKLAGAVSGNAASNNGGGLFTNGTQTIEGSVTGNTATRNGGGVYSTGGTLTNTGSITGNTATSGNGGGIYMASGTLNLNGGSVSDNTATSGNGGAIYALNVATTVMGGATLQGNGATSSTNGLGGALYMDGGSLTVKEGSTLIGNNANKGGAVYATSGSITVSNGNLTGNTAQNDGGAIYVKSASITANTASVTDPDTGETTEAGGSITGNTATTGNGGAIYSASGAVSISGGTFSGNKATNTANGLGGAVYAGSGNVTYSGGTITTNEAVNGAALYVGSGVAGITASITGNTPSSEDGGAIGVGSVDARLQFSGGAHVYNNTITIKVNNKDTVVQRNVCLNVDSESVIVATGVSSGKYIGIYVPGSDSSELVIKRGDIGGYFGAYTSDSNVDSVFKNDRFSSVVARHENDRLYWSSQLVYDVIYREAFTSTEPPTAGASYSNRNSYKTIAINKWYYPHAVDNNIYDLVMEMGLYKAYTSQFATAAGNATKAATSVYAYTYADKTNNSQFEAGLTFDDYLTKVTWDRSTHKWKFEKRDGTVITDKDRIVIIYAAPAYLTIVNNTDPALNLKLTNLTVLERDEAGSGHYGFVTARNGATAETLNPIVPSDLELSSGDSVKLLFPGAAGQSFTLSGTFTGNNVETATVKYTITGQAEKTLTATSQTADGLTFTLPANECTLTSDATTKEVRFGSPLPICKIGDETFSTLTEAKDYAVAQKAETGNKAYTIEMMVDYLQPYGDRLIIPDGLEITVTTAAKTGSNPYTGTGDRATLSRDVGNTGGPMIDSNSGTYSDGAYVSSLKVTNLIFDGRDLGGTGDGGAVRAKNMPVEIDNCQFKGFEATNGGAVYIDYDTANAADRTVYYAHGTLRITNSRFDNCRSSSAKDKTGGGALWTKATSMTLENCVLDACSCYKDYAQGGAVFHYITGDYSTGSSATLSNCTFTNCYVKKAAAGAIETEARTVTIEDSSFIDCYSSQKNGGAVNLWADGAEHSGADTSATFTRCYFKGCHNPTNGGAIRCCTRDLKIEDCKFDGCYGGTGGAIAMTNNNARKLEVYGSMFTGCYATGNGGAISAPTPKVTIGDSETINGTYRDGTANDGHTRFVNTYAKLGGGIYHTKNDVFTVTNAVFDNCRSTSGAGGGIYTNSGTLSITGTGIYDNFKDCTAQGSGGAVYQNRNAAGSTVALNNARFNNCAANNSGNGGGMYANARTLTVNYDTTTNSVVQNAESRFVNCTAANAGGGLYHDYTGTANIANCGFDGCTAKASYGGGLYTSAHTLSVTGENSRFTGCTAQTGGGGVYHNRDASGSSASYANCTFDRCITNGNNGGAIYEPAKTVTVTGCTIANSSAPANGGGIWINPSTATFTGGTISGNTVTNSDSKGAGIYIGGGTTTCKGTEIYNCTATGNGGGIYQNNDTLNILDGVVHGTASNGGGIYQYDSNAKVYQYGGQVGGTATANGGGLYKNNGTYTLGDGTVNGVAYSGGSIGKQISVQVQVVENNATTTRTDTFTTSAVNGGGVYQNQGTFNLNAGGSIGQKLTDADTGDFTYTATASGNGGGVYNFNGTFNMTDASICGSASGNGGGVWNGVTFKQNSGDIDGSATNGGGLYQSGTTAYTFTAGTITGTASESGGAVYHAGTNSFTVNSGCTVGQKMATDGEGNETVAASSSATNGGGVYLATGTVTVLSGGSIAGATASGNGGGAYVAGGTLNLGNASNTAYSGGDITGNRAVNGGGVYVNGGAFYLRQGNVTRNMASQYGGGVYHAGGTFSMSGGAVGGAPTGSGDETVENGNTAAKGGGLYVADGLTANINGWITSDGKNKIGAFITHNHATSEGGGIAVGTGAQLVFTNTVTVRDNTFGDGNTRCNVYLDQDSSAVIQKASLDEPSWIGVYASDAQDPEHGLSGKHFGTYSNTNNFQCFVNDRRPYLYGVKGMADGDNTNLIDWATFVCKITDDEGNLLYKDDSGTPAVYTKLENNGGTDRDNAFGTLMNAAPGLYRRVESEEDDGTVTYEPYPGSGEGAKDEYQVQMLEQRYELNQKITLASGKTVTLTTASTTEDECGFKYNGDLKNTEATIIRHANNFSMIQTNGGDLTLEKIILDGGSEEGYTNTSGSNVAGGILNITGGSQVTLNNKATLRNSTNEAKNGGAVRMAAATGDTQADANKLTMNSGSVIDNCVAGQYGGGVSVGNGTLEMNSGSRITNCHANLAAGNGGGGVRVDAVLRMNGGAIGGTVNGVKAGNEGGGITGPGTLYFSGDAIVMNNYPYGDSKTACNVWLSNDNDTTIHAQDLTAKANIGIYTAGDETNNKSMRYKRGIENRTFGTWDVEWTDDARPYAFVNDCDPLLYGGKVSDDKIYWLASPIINVTKQVTSDWSEDSNVDFSFTVKLIGKTFSSLHNVIGGLDFNRDAEATFTLKGDTTDGKNTRKAVLPTDYIGVSFTVTENLTEAQQADYTTKVQKDKDDPINSTTISGTLGENIDHTENSTSVSDVVFTNSRQRGTLTISNTAGNTDDAEKDFSFTLALGDETIGAITEENPNGKTYDAQWRTSGSDTVTDGTVTFIAGKAYVNGTEGFTLRNGQSLTILGLPTDLPFTASEILTEDEELIYRTRVSVNGDEALLVCSREGTVGGLFDQQTQTYSTTVAFTNSRIGVICKITNSDRNLLYYKVGDELVPAIYDRLEDAFAQVNAGGLRTKNNGSTSGTYRIEMVVPEYTMEEPASLSSGKTVILSTALYTDDRVEYPYNDGVDDGNGNTAVVYRGFDGGSMIVDNGTLTIDKIVLDGNSSANTGSGNGGIIQVSNKVKLTVNSKALLRDSRVIDTTVTGEGGTTTLVPGLGGAIWLRDGAQMVMEGTIENCSAPNGGGVYAIDRYKTINLSGAITGCQATGGDGGAIYAGTSTASTGITIGTGAQITDNVATGNGGGVFSKANVKLSGGQVGGSQTGEGNNANGGNGGGICLASGATFTMSAGEIVGNDALNGGGLYAKSTVKITGGSFAGNSANAVTVGEGDDQTATGGLGGAVYASENAAVNISGASTAFTGNSARIGGAIYDDGTVSMKVASLTGNSASESGGALYVEAGKSFTMQSGSITGNHSSQGAIATGEGSVLAFSGNSVVRDNTAAEETTAMNVHLGYDSNVVITTTGLGSGAYIGVYVADGEPEEFEGGADKPIYYDHGISGRNFGTYIGSTPDNARLYQFKNDRVMND